MRGRKISVQSKKTLPIHTDGECYQPTSATINVQRRALNVLHVPFINKSCYPNVHRVPGLVWYHPEEKAIINYLNGWKCVRKLGLSACAQNVLYHLNEKHLSKKVTTLFEELEGRGKTSASINAIIHRGSKKHRVRLPFFMNLATGFRFRCNISGPDVLTLGAMVQTNVKQGIPSDILGCRRRYGINDNYAVHVAKQLIESNHQPDFMLVYLPDNDHEIHRKSPVHAKESLIRVD